jgi:ATP-dependent Clp protease adaptor protein ClpS
MEHKRSENIDILERPKKRVKKLQPPKKYAVILHNDDYTPMEFVVWVLIEFFNKTEEQANSIMLEVHKKGKGVAGIYDFQIAEQKISEVADSAKEHDYPLQVTGESIE